jgi:alginate O-acetyltransferase complex protein AlgI
MLFNSYDFALFLPVVFLAYWALWRNLRVQNAFLVLASYVFFGWWDSRFLVLILGSTSMDYMVGRGLEVTKGRTARKAWLLASIVLNIALLGTFKYYDFFLESFREAFHFLGTPVDARPLGLLLPIGISFYTFQTMSYTLEVYRRQVPTTRDPIAFAAFVSFFPQLVAGPIERAGSLLPQFHRPRTFRADQAVDGLRQMLWGLFKKVVVADGCAEHADHLFGGSHGHTGWVLLLGALFFAIQIYGDFSGYSDIAIGTARLFGFSLMQNFRTPYFARDIAEFWRRWHISLSSWFRDHVYIPLGGSRGTAGQRIRNTFIIFLLSGFWHGANWTFLAWGALHALYFIPLQLRSRNRRHLDDVAPGRLLPSAADALRMAGTFLLTLLAWVFFRADDLGHAFSYLQAMSHGMVQPGNLVGAALWLRATVSPILLAMVIMLFSVEWLGRTRAHALQLLGASPAMIRQIAYHGLVLLIFLHVNKPQEFIYFQF